MSDVEEIVEQEQPEIILDEKPSRKRGRPRKEEPVKAQVQVEEKRPKTATRRRSTKLTGDDVSKGITLLSQFAVLMTKHEHWYIPPEETKPWSGEAANLLNRIPAKYINAVTNMSSVVVVTVGLYSTIVPRLLIEQELQERAKKPARNGTEPAYAGNGYQA